MMLFQLQEKILAFGGGNKNGLNLPVYPIARVHRIEPECHQNFIAYRYF